MNNILKQSSYTNPQIYVSIKNSKNETTKHFFLSWITMQRLKKAL